MSYILDALRRADAERQRGGVPGLHAPVVPGPAAAGEGEPPQARRGLLLVGAALLLVAGLGAGWYVGRTPPAAAPPDGGIAGGPVALAPGVPPAAPTAVPGLAPPPAMPANAPVATAGVVPAPPPQAAPVVAAPARLPPPVAASVVRAPAMAAPPSAATTSTAGRSPSPAPAARVLPAAEPVRPLPAQAPVTDARLPTWAELPEALRREMPALSLGGAMHAEQAELRVAIVNGQVFHEGDPVAPGLTVRSIRPKAVVFDFRGQRFEMPL
jgi:general secretion pathway protein B